MVKTEGKIIVSGPCNGYQLINLNVKNLCMRENKDNITNEIISLTIGLGLDTINDTCFLVLIIYGRGPCLARGSRPSLRYRGKVLLNSIRTLPSGRVE